MSSSYENVTLKLLGNHTDLYDGNIKAVYNVQ